MSKTNIQSEDVKKLAQQEVDRIIQEEETKKAVDEEVKLLLADRKEKEKEEVYKKQCADKDKLIKSIRISHGNTMRQVNKHYSAESKPMFIDKGV